MPEFVGTYKELLDLLNEDGVAHQADQSDLSVVIPTERGELDAALLLRWQESDGVLQLIQQIPLEVAADRWPSMAEAIVRLNHELAVPGVGMSYADPVLYFRTYVPIATGPVPATVIRALFSVSVNTAANVMPVLRKVLSGETPPSDVIAAMADQMSSGAGSGSG